MEIKKNSFLWKIAYTWSNKEEAQEVKTTNLCRFFWRVMLGLVLATVVIILYYVILLCEFLFGFFVARYPVAKGIHSQKGPFNIVKYQKWPTVKGHRIYPIVVLLISAAAIGIVEVGIHYPKDLMYGIGILIGLVALVVLVAIKGWFITSGFKRFRRSDAYRLTKEYLRARKEKVCPTIIFVD